LSNSFGEIQRQWFRQNSEQISPNFQFDLGGQLIINVTLGTCLAIRRIKIAEIAPKLVEKSLDKPPKALTWQ
jgi:hypothetical protein